MSAEFAPHHDFEVDDEATQDEAILAAVRAGQYASHAAVRNWLLSKDTANPQSRPQPGD